MAYTFEQIFAVDESNPANVARNATVLIFAPGDTAKTPLALTTPAGDALANPVPVNANGFGSAFIQATLDRVAWEGGGFTGFFTSYDGMKEEAVAAREAAQDAAANAAAAAEADLAARVAAGEFTGAPGADGSNVLPTDDAIEQAIITPGTKTGTALSATIDDKVSTSVPPLVVEVIADSPAVSDAAALAVNDYVTANGVQDTRIVDIAEDGLWVSYDNGDTKTQLVDGTSQTPLTVLPESVQVAAETVDTLPDDSPWEWAMGLDGTDGTQRVTLGQYKTGEYFPAGLNGGAAKTPVVGVGDSFTQYWYNVFPELLDQIGRPGVNTGIGGQRPDHIGARNGGAPALVTVQDNVILASGPTSVTFVRRPMAAGIDDTATFMDILLDGTSIRAELAGILGTFARSGAAYTFTPTTAGIVTPCPADTPLHAGMEYVDHVPIICVGRNGFKDMTVDQILYYVRKIVYRFPRWREGVVLSIPPDTADTAPWETSLAAVQAALKAEFTEAWFDWAAYLRSEAVLTANGITPTATDITNIAAGDTPASFRLDTGHYNAAGYRAVMPRIAALINMKARVN